MAFKPISRRTVLRGLGTSIALPFLDAMTPSAGLLRQSAAASANPVAAPVRMAMFFLPNGMNMQKWLPTSNGDDWELPPTLQPLADLRKEISVISGLTLKGATAQGDGAGDHARSAAAFLTGAHPHKTAGADIRLGVSMDQVAAAAIGGQTRFPSIELGLETGETAGECDSGYSCAYVSNISWRTPTNPVPHEVNPAAVFDRLFGSDDDRAAVENRMRRLRERKSILDFVAEDSRNLAGQLGKSDRDKLDEFTTSIRQVERQVEAARNESSRAADPGIAKPHAIPQDFGEHMRLMTDMLVLAFRMDLSRVSTFMVARDGSPRTYRNLGLSEGHHALSHHSHDPAKLDGIAKIDLFHMQQFAYFLKQLQSVKEEDRTLLENSIIMLGCGIADGDRHNHNNLPILLAGRGGGTLNPGRHIQAAGDTPLCNLYLSMLHRIGVKQDRFGDSTAPLTDL